MPELLDAFAPLRCVTHGLLGSDAVLTRQATVLFVDLVGFTPLTDRLGAFGSRGTEQLSQVIRGFFGQVTAEALDLGGDPVAYGGDALTIIFDGARDDTLHAAAVLAGSVQQLALRTSGQLTLAGPVGLETRIGIARGPVTTMVVRSTDRSVPVQLGLGLDLAVAAESAAANGQVVFHESTEPSTNNPDESHPAGNHIAPASVEELQRLVHPVVRGRLSTGHEILESHRFVTVAFLGFPPLGPDRAAAFRRTAGHLLQSVVDCGGEVVQVSGGDKGIVAMAVFGAPIGHDDDPLRAIQAALEQRRHSPEVKVGITTGPVFTTTLGSSRRLFHAHFGSTVNVAARLMQAARPRQILVDGPSWVATSAHLRQHGSPEVRAVKGRSEPVQVHEVARWRRRRQLAPPPLGTPLVGRDALLAAMEQLLDDLQRGHGTLRSLEGDAGIGKSRLARECVDRAATRGLSVVLVDADDYPYRQLNGLWRDLLSSRLQIPTSADRHVWLEALSARLPDRSAQFSALSPLLGVRLGAGDAPVQHPPDVEAELALDLVSRILRGEPDDDPLLVVVENVHHFDDRSRDLMSALGQRLKGSSVGILTTRRGQPDRPDHPGGPTTGLWPVDELTAAATSVLVEDTWRQSGGGTPPDWLASSVYRRAGGNPLFVRAVTHQLRRSWQPGDPPPADDSTGESLASLLAERVDELAATPRQVLAVLAVARRPCPLQTAASVLPAHLTEEAVASAARQLEAGNYIRPLRGHDDAVYRIRHNVLRQVVYEQMSHAERDQIHRGLATRLIADGADAREIAEHVRHLDDPSLARQWFPLAAGSARASWNVPEAVDWWRHALPLLSGPPHDEAEVELLEVLLVGGRANDALELADQRALDAQSDVAEVGNLTIDTVEIRRRIATAEAALVCGDFDRCEAECRNAVAFPRPENEIYRQRAGELLVRALCERGSLEDAVQLAKTQLDQARLSGDGISVATASASLGAALLLSGDPAAAATHYAAAREGAVANGDTVHEIHVLSDLAGCVFAAGDHTRCLELLTEARQLADRIGYRRHLVVNLSNEAHLRAALGDPHAAACAALALDRSLALGDLATAANCCHTWVSSDESFAASPDLWLRLAQVNALLHRDFETAEGHANLALAAARRSDLDTARWAWQQAVAHPAAMGDGALARPVDLAQLIVHAKDLQPGQVKEQSEVLTALEALARREEASEVERAEISLERWRISEDEATRAAAVSDLEAAFVVEPSAVVRSWFGEVGAELPNPPDPLPPPVGIGRTEVTFAELDAALTQLETAVRLRSTA